VEQLEGATGTDPGAAAAAGPESLMKHPLQNKWALWFFKNDKSKDWAANLKMITAFDTVEDFWG
jgi:translation initiation factor 4E